MDDYFIVEEITPLYTKVMHAMCPLCKAGRVTVQQVRDASTQTMPLDVMQVREQNRAIRTKQRYPFVATHTRD